MTTRYASKAVIGIESQFQDLNNNPIITANGKITVRRLSDDFYAQDASGASFLAAPLLLGMTRVGDTNSPGWWKFDFDTSSLPNDDYIFTVTDGNSIAKNVPQTAKAIVGDLLSQLIEAIGNGEGKVLYDPSTSILTIFKLNDPATISRRFNCKDKNGNPSGFGEIFEKIPI